MQDRKLDDKGDFSRGIRGPDSADDALHSQSHRKLLPRHVHLIAIGGTIGTAIFTGIGIPLTSGGPLSLLLGYTIWCSFVWCINECQAEMVCQLPIESSFVQFAGRYVDESVAVAVGYTYFIGWTALVAFEIVAFGIIIDFWTPIGSVGKGVVVIALILAYGALNIWNVKYFGELEFWSAIGKVFLIAGLILMTFIVMVGGNPRHWAFGFTYWKNPGAMAEYIHTGSLGRFEGLLACIIYAGFSVGGPDVLSLSAGETVNPRKAMPFAFKSVMLRLVLVYIVGALCVGIIVPYNNEYLLRAIANGSAGAAKSPYVIGAQILNIRVLPHIVNAGIATSVFSAGNAYTFCASRALYGLAVNGQAPLFLRWRNRNGVPVYAVGVVLALGLLAFMQLNASANNVLNWWINLVTASQLIMFIVMAVTHIRWTKAMKVQGFSRDDLPYKSSIQPYAAWYGLVGCVVILLANGYTVFLSGLWNSQTFIFSYFMIPFFLVVMFGWKLWHRTQWRRAETIDLIGEAPQIDAYEIRLEEVKMEHELLKPEQGIRQRGKRLLNAAGVVFW